MYYYRRHSEVTFREVLFCFVIAAVLFSIGFWISGAIGHKVNQRLLKYRQAAQIENNNAAFALALKTDVGDAFVEGQFKAIDPVRHENIAGNWTMYEANHQKYTRHTRIVTYTVSNGKGGTRTKTRTEHYWTWDTFRTEKASVKTVEFCEEKISFKKFDPTYSCFISKTVDTGYHLRVLFNLIPSSFHAACYSTLKDGTISDKTPIYRNRTVQELYKDYTTSYAVRIFWGIWIVVIIVALVVFVLHDNDWLEY